MIVGISSLVSSTTQWYRISNPLSQYVLCCQKHVTIYVFTRTRPRWEEYGIVPCDSARVSYSSRWEANVPGFMLHPSGLITTRGNIMLAKFQTTCLLSSLRCRCFLSWVLQLRVNSRQTLGINPSWRRLNLLRKDSERCDRNLKRGEQFVRFLVISSKTHSNAKYK